MEHTSISDRGREQRGISIKLETDVAAVDTKG